jgi:hypothetical protein
MKHRPPKTMRITFIGDDDPSPRQVHGVKAQVLESLLDGESITQKSVMTITTRLAAIVHALKTKHRLPIVSKLIKVRKLSGGTARVSKYFIPANSLDAIGIVNIELIEVSK